MDNRDTARGNTRASQRKQLQAWLGERRCDLALRQHTQARQPAMPPPKAPHGPPPKAGDIRLLLPTALSLPELERPLYLLVLAAPGTDVWDVVPFSRLALPATPLEWITGISSPPLRVLCLWNRTRLTTAALCRTWRIRAIPRAKLATANRIARTATQTQAADRIPHRNIGPPLLHPLDPRCAYLAEERLLFEESTRPLPVAPTQPLYLIAEPDIRLQRAADPPSTNPTSMN